MESIESWKKQGSTVKGRSVISFLATVMNGKTVSMEIREIYRIVSSWQHRHLNPRCGFEIGHSSQECTL